MIEKHFTVTTYVINKKKVLLIFHPKHKKWLPPGGHLELNETPPTGALREVLEETGLEVEIIRNENLWVDCWNAASFERPYLCLLENIPAHNSHPAHQHMDLIYLARPTGNGLLNDGHSAKWFSLEEILELETDVEIFGETKQTIQHILENH